MGRETGILASVSHGLGAAISEWSVYLSMVRRIFPLAKAQLGRWEQRAREIPNPELRRQALASIHKKSFHSVGGAVFALMNRPEMNNLVAAIVAIQTISDYLDNLCDRAAFGIPGSGLAGVTQPNDLDTASQAFSCSMKLHEAMICALDPDMPMSDFYSDYPAEDDGGYLEQLVVSSRDVLDRLENYSVVKPLVAFFAAMYSEMQSIKHLSPGLRDTLMEQWFSLYSGKEVPDGAGIHKLVSSQGGIALKHLKHAGPSCVFTGFAAKVDHLKWWEFGAAAGSTLGIFSLISYASLKDGLGVSHGAPGYDVGCISSAYFPWVCGLHILLDYFIDQEEDRETGDLNFVSYYDSPGDAIAALNRFTRASLKRARHLPHSWFHRAVIRGLLAMYLSDPKVKTCGLSSYARLLTAQGNAGLLRLMCGVARAFAAI